MTLVDANAHHLAALTAQTSGSHAIRAQLRCALKHFYEWQDRMDAPVRAVMKRSTTRRDPRPGSLFPSQIVAQRAREVRRLPELSQGDVADRMQALGYPTWRAQTVSQVEAARRSVSVDELVSLAAALQVMVAHLLSPASATDPDDVPVDVGGPEPLDRDQLRALYGFNRHPLPHSFGFYEWPDLRFKVAGDWDEATIGWEDIPDE